MTLLVSVEASIQYRQLLHFHTTSSIDYQDFVVPNSAVSTLQASTFKLRRDFTHSDVTIPGSAEYIRNVFTTEFRYVTSAYASTWPPTLRYDVYISLQSGRCRRLGHRRLLLYRRAWLGVRNVSKQRHVSENHPVNIFLLCDLRTVKSISEFHS